MDSNSIQLVGSEIDAIEHTPERLRLHFSRAIIVKTMTGSAEKTLWWQAGDLLLAAPELDGELPATPCTCAGGDVEDNIYTYRDMIPLPLDSRGRVGLELKFDADKPPLRVHGEAIRLEMQDTPKYQRHIRDE